MNQRRKTLLQQIDQERQRQLNLPGSEFDATRDPNDWLAMVGKYLFGSASTKNVKPSAEDFENDLVKASAVLLAALEHIDKMKENNKLQ